MAQCASSVLASLPPVGEPLASLPPHAALVGRLGVVPLGAVGMGVVVWAFAVNLFQALQVVSTARVGAYADSKAVHRVSRRSGRCAHARSDLLRLLDSARCHKPLQDSRPGALRITDTVPQERPARKVVSCEGRMSDGCARLRAQASPLIAHSFWIALGCGVLLAGGLYLAAPLVINGECQGHRPHAHGSIELLCAAGIVAGAGSFLVPLGLSAGQLTGRSSAWSPGHPAIV
jgi:hypothetical protein